MHLALALVISAVMSAPWTTLGTAGIIMLLCGLCGLAYAALVILRTRKQTAYVPVWQDWVWYAILPSLTYLALSVSAWLLDTSTEESLFTIAGVALVLILIAVHNAWDSITHIVVEGADHA